MDYPELNPNLIALQQAVQDIREKHFCASLLAYNEALRSTLSVAKRCGLETNWEAFSASIEKVLNQNHETWVEARQFQRDNP